MGDEKTQSNVPATENASKTALRTRYVPAPATDYYTRIGLGLVAGIGLVGFIALLNPGGLGLLELGTSMTMIGTAFTVGFAGLLVTLFILRSTLRSIDARAEYLAAESLRKASERERIWAPMTMVEGHQQALDDLSEFGSRQAEAVAGLQSAAREHGASIGRLDQDVASLASWRSDAERILSKLRTTGAKGLGDLQAEFSAYKAATANDAKERDEALKRLRAEGARQNEAIERLSADAAAGVKERDAFISEIQAEAARHADAMSAASKELARLAERDDDLASKHAQIIKHIEASETENREAVAALAAADAAISARQDEAADALASHKAEHLETADAVDRRVDAIARSLEAKDAAHREAVEGFAADVAEMRPLAQKALRRVDDEEKGRRIAVANLEDRVTNLSAREDDVYDRHQKLEGRLQVHEGHEAAVDEALFTGLMNARQSQENLRLHMDDVERDHAGAIGKLAVGLGKSYAKGRKADIAAGARIQALAARDRDEAEAIKKLAQGMDALAAREEEAQKQVAAQGRRVDAARKRLAKRIDALRTEQREALHKIEVEESRQEVAFAALAKKESAAEHSLADEVRKREDAVNALRAKESQIAARLAGDEKAFEARQAEAAKRMDELRNAIKADVQALAAEEARLDRRIDAGQRARRRAVDAMRVQEAQIAQRVERNERAIRSAVTRMEAERARLDAIMKRILEEERQRKREFEALASEEMRIMGRVLKRNEASERALEEATAAYWVARPKSKDKGPFGLVYRLNQVEGMTAAAVRKLRKLEIKDTEDLWRADSAFLADYLGVDRKTVELWQEEAELMAIDGIGGQTAEALAHAGVTSIEKLSTEEPDHLVRLVAKTNGHGPVSKRNAQKWIKAARKYAPAK